MRGLDHIRISIFCGLAFCAPWFIESSVLVMTAIVGILIGSLLPDSDAEDRKAKHLGSIIFVFDRLNEVLIYPFLRLLFGAPKKHRGILHTFTGVFISSLILSIITGIVLFFFAKDFNILVFGIVFGIGLFAGGVMHILEDSCTVEGVKPFIKYNIRFSGNFRTFSSKEPALFSKYFLFLFVFLLVGQVYFKIPTWDMAIYSTIIVLVSWIGFILISRA